MKMSVDAISVKTQPMIMIIGRFDQMLSWTWRIPLSTDFLTFARGSMETVNEVDGKDGTDGNDSTDGKDGTDGKDDQDNKDDHSNSSLAFGDACGCVFLSQAISARWHSGDSSPMFGWSQIFNLKKVSLSTVPVQLIIHL